MTKDLNVDDLEALLNASGATRPKVKFLPMHIEVQMHAMSITHPASAFVPVLIGPSLPRHDRPNVDERYSRLMLMMFKPW
jgi:hypothetical protein